MAKRTTVTRFSMGVIEPLRDLFAAAGNPTQNQNAGTNDNGTVAILGVSANELAVPQGINTPGGGGVQTHAALGTTTYTSDVFYTAGFGRIVGTILSDASGSLYIDQSSDGTHWDFVTTVSVTGTTTTVGASFSVEVVAPYARVRFAPSTTNSVLRLYPWLRRLGSA